MSMQTNAEAKKEREQTMIEKYGVRIGNAEWEAIRDYYFNWVQEVENLKMEYASKNMAIPNDSQERLDMQSLFFEAVMNVYDYILRQQSMNLDFSGELDTYWVVNPEHSQYFISYDGVSIYKKMPSFQELMGYYAYGVVKGVWTVQDVLSSPMSKCRVSKFLLREV